MQGQSVTNIYTWVKNKMRVVVVGGGLGGLSTGALLCRRGFEVQLLEKERQLGGRAKVSKIHGFRVDHGVHASLFAEKSAGAVILGKIGHRLRARWCGMVFHEEGRFRGLIGRNAIMDLQEKLRLFLNLSREVRKIHQLYRVSIREWLEETGSGEGTEKFMLGLGIALMASTHLERLSMGELLHFLRNVVRKRRSFGYPAEGWSSVLDPLIGYLQKHATIRMGTEIQEIVQEKGRAVGVMAGKELVADFVVFAAPAQLLPSIAALPEAYRKKLESILPTAGVILDLGLDEPVSRLRDVIITLDPPTLGWFTSNLAPVVPPGRQLLTTFMPMDAEELVNPRLVRRKLGTLEEKYLTIFPGMEHHILWRRGFGTLVNGAELNTRQTRLDRPSIKTPVQNLFLVGDTTNEEGAGAEISFNSALRCAEIIVSAQAAA